MADIPFVIAPRSDSMPSDAQLGRVYTLTYVDVNASLSSTNPAKLLLTDVDAIEEQMLNVVLTPLSSDEFEPLYGTQVPLLLFDPVTNTTARALRSTIINGLKRWMGNRISDLSVFVVANDDLQSYTATFTYFVPGLSRSRVGFRALLIKR
jgi:phage baseplate assembly protein W